jgi:hypothetical protein
MKETIQAINTLIERGFSELSVRKIRAELSISSKNKSRISFIWRTLKRLEMVGELSLDHINSSKIYKIRESKKIEMGPEKLLQETKL